MIDSVRSVLFFLVVMMVLLIGRKIYRMWVRIINHSGGFFRPKSDRKIDAFSMLIFFLGFKFCYTTNVNPAR